jgi:undecaprenyl-diphosphatase
MSLHLMVTSGTDRHGALGAPDDGPDDPPLPDATRARRDVLLAGAILVSGVAFTLLLVAAGAQAGLGLADAAVLGVVEGITEWLPISSTGHLAVTQRLLGLDGAAADSYAIAIQAGAILAVLGLYRHRFGTMVKGITHADQEGRHLVFTVALACMPAVAVGLAFEDVIKDNLFGVWPITVAWAVGGVAILVVAAHRRRQPDGLGLPLDLLSLRSALMIGCAQCIALWPGTSRSLVTILAATAVGLSLPAAIEFSFLVGFVTLGGATLYEFASSGDDMINAYGLAAPLLGLAFAFVTAVLAMRWMVDYLAAHDLSIFGWYRLTVAALAGLLLVTNAI